MLWVSVIELLDRRMYLCDISLNIAVRCEELKYTLAKHSMLYGEHIVLPLINALHRLDLKIRVVLLDIRQKDQYVPVARHSIY